MTSSRLLSTALDNTLFLALRRPSPSPTSETQLTYHVHALLVEVTELAAGTVEVGGNSNFRVTEIFGVAFAGDNVGVFRNHGPVVVLAFKWVGIHGDLAYIWQGRPSGERGAGDETVLSGVVGMS